jgi:N6-adenosine-specific RNA methylase IME4
MDLARAIREAHEACVASFSLERAFVCGDLLLEAKYQTPHGEFTEFLQGSCGVSVRQARSYLALSQGVGKGKRASFLASFATEGLNASLRGALKRLSAPRGHNQATSQPEVTCTTRDLKSLLRRGLKFGTIYADPPWPYGNQATRAATKNHYKSYNELTIDDIALLPIRELAGEKSHLHLWTTNGFLHEAFGILEAWGFEYKSCFVWVKPQLGIGNYWRVSHEFMLLGVRGAAPFLDKKLKSWAEIPRGPHSQKPEVVRAFIQRASPGPRLELFGRRAVTGWAVWGNEVRRELFEQGVEEYVA